MMSRLPLVLVVLVVGCTTSYVDPTPGFVPAPCARGAETSLALCADGCSNDLDDLVDCADPDCASACAHAEDGGVDDGGVAADASDAASTSDTGPPCPHAGEIRCTDGCRNVQTNPANCGACGRVCPAGSVCVDAECQRTGSTELACGTSCVDATTDRENCGACGNHCRFGACRSGHCEEIDRIFGGERTEMCLSFVGGTMRCFGGSGFVSRDQPSFTLPAEPVTFAVSSVIGCGTAGDGTAFCFGSPECTLGRARVAGDAVPAAVVPGIGVATSVDTTGTLACFGTASGATTCCGYNVGQYLFPSLPESIVTPTAIAGLPPPRLVVVASPSSSLCVVSSVDGTVSCTGGRYPSSGTPHGVYSMPSTTGVSRMWLDQTLYVQLPDESVSLWAPHPPDQACSIACTPAIHVPAPALGGAAWAGATATQYALCAVLADRHVQCLGPLSLVPGTGTRAYAQVPGIDDVVDLAVDPNSACAVRGDGSLWCWGARIWGATVAERATTATMPEEIELP